MANLVRVGQKVLRESWSSEELRRQLLCRRWALWREDRGHEDTLTVNNRNGGKTARSGVVTRVWEVRILSIDAQTNHIGKQAWERSSSS
eukprot:1241683-Amphidinium_carterae.1